MGHSHRSRTRSEPPVRAPLKSDRPGQTSHRWADVDPDGDEEDVSLESCNIPVPGSPRGPPPPVPCKPRGPPTPVPCNIPSDVPSGWQSDDSWGHDKRDSGVQRAALRARESAPQNPQSPDATADDDVGRMPVAARAPCDVVNPWVRWERDQVGI